MSIAVCPIRSLHVHQALQTFLLDLPIFHFSYPFLLNQQNLSLINDDPSTAHVKHRVWHHHILSTLKQPPIQRDGLALPSMKPKVVDIHQIR